MENSYALAFDVGGTTIKAAVVDSSGRVDESSFLRVNSRSAESSEAILEHFYQLIRELAGSVRAAGGERLAPNIYGVGFAFPGPFDYEQGISYIRGLDKFDALFGVAVKQKLADRIRQDAELSARLVDPQRIVFGNDAELFALGEALYGEGSRFSRSISLTIGTGLGSAFIEAGCLIRDRKDVPPSGWLYQLPYMDGIIDDYVSRRGFLHLAESAGLHTRDLDVKDIAELAQNGEPAAKAVFEQFGSRLGRILVPHANAFKPGVIIFGGQISESLGLFAPSLADELSRYGCMAAIAKSPNTLYSTFRGVNRLVRTQ